MRRPWSDLTDEESKVIGDLLTDDGAQGELIDEIDEAKPVSQPVGDEAEEAQEAGGE